MDCSMPGFPVHHQLPELAQTHVHQISDAIRPSHPVFPFSSYLQSFPASGSFLMSQFFASGGQSIGASLMYIGLSLQGRFSPDDWLMSQDHVFIEVREMNNQMNSALVICFRVMELWMDSFTGWSEHARWWNLLFWAITVFIYLLILVNFSFLVKNP